MFVHLTHHHKLFFTGELRAALCPINRILISTDFLSATQVLKILEFRSFWRGVIWGVKYVARWASDQSIGCVSVTHMIGWKLFS